MSEKATSVESFVIELTRRCNAMCEHCLRGDREDSDLNIAALEAFFDNSDIITLSSLTLSGGEPSIACHEIREVLRILKEKDIVVGQIYLATNAFDIQRDFIDVIKELHDYVYDHMVPETESIRDILAIDISNDQYHPVDVQSRRLLRMYACVGNKYPNGVLDKSLTEGRGNEVAGKLRNISPADTLHMVDHIIEGTLYLNVEGDLHSCCDISFYNQGEESSHFIGNTLEEGFNFKEKLEEYNAQF